MKKITIIIVSIMLLTSCTKSPQEKMKENITVQLKEMMNDPSTFEFVSMNIKKTFTAAERKEIMNEEKLKRVQELGMTDLIEQTKKEMEFLMHKDGNFEAVYYVDFVARGSNKFGAIIKGKYSATVLNDENRTVVHFKSMN